MSHGSLRWLQQSVTHTPARPRRFLSKVRWSPAQWTPRPAARQARGTKGTPSVVAALSRVAPDVLEDHDVAAYRAGQPDGIRAVYREYGRLVFAVTLPGPRADRAHGRGSHPADLRPGLEGRWLLRPGPRVGAMAGHDRPAGGHRRPPWRESLKDPRTAAAEDVVANDPSMISLPPEAEQIYDVWEVRRAVDGCPTRSAQRRTAAALRGDDPRRDRRAPRAPLGTVKSRSYRAHKRLAGGLGHLREVVR